MCGIAGIFLPEAGAPINRALLEAMAASLRHRGPDGDGIHIEPHVGFAHRRLSIIDLAHGAQPVSNPAGTVTLTYNGEVYNFRELKAELQHLGYAFSTNCDTEVVLRAWEAWGESCVERLRGMFAFAIWDRPRRTLFLARDRLGIKPLYYANLTGGGIAFASELKALLVHPKVHRELDDTAIEDYFAYGYIPDPKTVFKSVRKLPPGYTLSVDPGSPRLAPRQYWDVPLSPTGSESMESACGELFNRLKDAVDCHMVADVPLGAFLSGGVDSSAVVAAMARVSDQPINTCSIGFDEPGFDETGYARTVATQFRTIHQERQVSSNDYNLIDTLAALYDEPYADSSAIPTYRVCGLARERVTVALSGDGGDENFVGYRRHRMHANEARARAMMPTTLRSSVFGFLGSIYPKADWAPQIFRAKSTFYSLARDNVTGYFHGVSMLPDPLRLPLYSDGFLSRLQGHRAVDVFHAYAKEAPTNDPVALAQYLDFKTYLPGDILTKVDRASMAHSLEVRVPILDHLFVEWAASLPSEFKLRRGEGKYVLKKALEPHLSNDILYRRKMGFSIPLARWFRGPLREQVRSTLTGERLADGGIFRPERLRKLVDQHESGQRDHGTEIWSLLMWDAFLRNLEGWRNPELPENTQVAAGIA